MRNSGSWKREQKRKAAGKDGSKRGYGKLYRRDLAVHNCLQILGGILGEYSQVGFLAGFNGAVGLVHAAHLGCHDGSCP